MGRKMECGQFGQCWMQKWSNHNQRRPERPGAVISALKTVVAAKRVGITTPIESLVRESQCNGAVEQAVRRWQGQLRTITHNYEGNLGKNLPVTHPLMGWLALWSGEALLKFKVRESGRTACAC